MTPREQKVIERLKARVEDPSRASDEGLAKVHAPVKARSIAAAERELRFQFPDMLRAIYTQVGNGGFGRAYGFIGIQGGATEEFGRSLVKVYQDMVQYHQKDSPLWHWPEQLLPVCRLGCGMWSCLDCKRAAVPVFIFDPNNLESDPEDDEETRLRWANAFWLESRSFVSWLGSWLNDDPEKEPKCPSRAWLKERIGYIPKEW
jgi:hypothetical protein